MTEELCSACGRELTTNYERQRETCVRCLDPDARYPDE